MKKRILSAHTQQCRSTEREARRSWVARQWPSEAGKMLHTAGSAWHSNQLQQERACVQHMSDEDQQLFVFASDVVAAQWAVHANVCG